jgi:hypothetical protein
MTTSIAAIIIAFVKAVPAIRDIFVASVDQYYKIQENASDNEINKKKKELDLIVSKMKEAKTDEERIILHRIRVKLMS